MTVPGLSERGAGLNCASLPLPESPPCPPPPTWSVQAGAMTVPELSEGLNLISLKSHNWHVQASCALTGEGLLDGLKWVAEELRRKEAAPAVAPQT